MRPPKTFQPPAQEGPKTNDRIRAAEVRLIGDDGQQLGVLTLADALAKAEEAGLDLVEVSPNASPPVCRLVDYGKFKYMQSKKAQEARKKQAVVEVKEIQLTPNIDKHDLETKQNHIRRWVAEKARVRVSLRFRGRELSHTEIGFRTMTELIQSLEDVVTPESPPRMEGRKLVVTLLPKSEKPGPVGPTITATATSIR